MAKLDLDGSRKPAWYPLIDSAVAPMGLDPERFVQKTAGTLVLTGAADEGLPVSLPPPSVSLGAIAAFDSEHGGGLGSGIGGGIGGGSGGETGGSSGGTSGDPGSDPRDNGERMGQDMGEATYGNSGDITGGQSDGTMEGSIDGGLDNTGNNNNVSGSTDGPPQQIGPTGKPESSWSEPVSGLDAVLQRMGDMLQLKNPEAEALARTVVRSSLRSYGEHERPDKADDPYLGRERPEAYQDAMDAEIPGLGESVSNVMAANKTADDNVLQSYGAVSMANPSVQAAFDKYIAKLGWAQERLNNLLAQGLDPTSARESVEKDVHQEQTEHEATMASADEATLQDRIARMAADYHFDHPLANEVSITNFHMARSAALTSLNRALNLSRSARGNSVDSNRMSSFGSLLASNIGANTDVTSSDFDSDLAASADAQIGGLESTLDKGFSAEQIAQAGGFGYSPEQMDRATSFGVKDALKAIGGLLAGGPIGVASFARTLFGMAPTLSHDLLGALAISDQKPAYGLGGLIGEGLSTLGLSSLGNIVGMGIPSGLIGTLMSGINRNTLGATDLSPGGPVSGGFSVGGERGNENKPSVGGDTSNGLAYSVFRAASGGGGGADLLRLPVGGVAPSMLMAPKFGKKKNIPIGGTLEVAPATAPYSNLVEELYNG